MTESLLLLVIFAMLTQLVFKTIKQKDIFQTVFASPWSKISNVIHYGVSVVDPVQAKNLHPANFGRHQVRRD